MSVQRLNIKYITYTITILLTFFLVSGCDMAANQMHTDRSGNYDVQDYRDGLAAREIPQEEFESEVNDIPELQSYIAPAGEDLKPMKLVSIQLDQNVPLRDALFELAKEVDYDIELDPRIRGSVIFTARNRPFDTVIKRISEIAGLRYSFEGNVLRVELDTPYTKNYPVNYLSMIRTNKSYITADISVVTSKTADTGSSYKVKNEFESDFWKYVEEGIKQILETATKTSYMKTDIDPQISVSKTANAPVQPLPASTLEDENTDEGKVKTVSSPNAVLNVQSLPATTNTGGGNSAKANEIDYTPSYSINRHAGIISVYSSEKLHKEIEKYLKEVKKTVTSQVLIEAKVLEVSLTDEYSAGIDWNAINRNKNASGSQPPFAFSLDMFSRGNLPPTSSGLRFLLVKDDIGAAIDALSEFGTVKALASPRVTVVNNQTAILNVAKNVVFFEIDIDVTVDSGQSQTEVTSDVKTVPEGVLINVAPSIDIENNSILMAVRPTITNIGEFKRDPGVEFVKASAGIVDDTLVNEVPVVQVQELDSVLQLNSGEVMIMGGLLQDRTVSTQNSVPVLGEIPFIGKAFSSQSDSVKKSELVIFLKATILDGSNVHNTDKDLYKMFSHDRRPARM